MSLQRVTGILENKTILFNLIFNTKGITNFNLGKWDPFIGGGLGISINRVANIHGNSTVGIKDNETIKFAWQVMGGIRYYFTEQLNIEAGYRFVHFGDFFSGNKWMFKLDDNPPMTMEQMKGKVWAQELFVTLIFRIC